ncbi:MAG: segregation/condensation protein A [Pirellulaceae bacterium]
MNFRVDLTIFRGPLDLLLYLVRKHELDILNIPIAKVTAQYVTYMEVLQELNPNAVGDFIEMASTLIEIKSRMVLPRADEADEPLEDPREDLVEKLLEYKKYKDAAAILEDRGRGWQQSYSRLANDLPPRRIDPADQPIHEVELWDLVSAFGRVMREHETSQPSSIVYDDTPIHVHMQNLCQRIASEGRVGMMSAFEAGMHKSSLIGIFLAVLELVRHHHVEAEQDEQTGEIWVYAGTEFQADADFSAADQY